MTTTAHRPELAATRRDVVGKKVSRLRREGRLPAVVFGHGEQSVPVTVDAHEFELLRRRVGPNTLIDLSVDGHRARRVLVHGVQFDPVSRRPLHADLFLVRMREELTVDVPVVTVGSSVAVDKQGGTLLHTVSSVKVRALPDHLPQVIEVSIEPLVDFDAAIHVRDLPIPAGVTLLTDPDEVVAKTVPPRVEEVPVPTEEAVEGAEPTAAGEEPGEEPAAES